MGDNLPAVQFSEHKKHHPSKSVQEEQRREQRRTMQRTILHPIQPLGEPTNQLVTETSTSRSRQQSSNSLIVEGGSMALIPISNSASTTPRPVNTRHVSSGSLSRRGSNGQILSTTSSNNNMHPELSHFMEAMNASNKSLFRRSYKEVLEDYDIVKERLVRARQDNDVEAEDLYNNMRKNLEAELQSTA